MSRYLSTNLPEIVTYEEIKSLPKKPDTILIDVREQQELIDTGVVPTSINIPCRSNLLNHLQKYLQSFFLQVGQVAEKLSKDFPEKEFLKLFNRKKPTPDTEIIFMCKVGGRSHNAMELTRKLGYKK